MENDWKACEKCGQTLWRIEIKVWGIRLQCSFCDHEDFIDDPEYDG